MVGSCEDRTSIKIDWVKLQDNWDVEEEMIVRHTPQMYSMVASQSELPKRFAA